MAGCSTPSGIMESVTLIGMASVLLRISAQRLPASWNRSHCDDGYFGALLCVLNAFRHHGIGHPESIAPLAGCSRAQRLPASWNRSPRPSVFVAASVLCSTPSGIMESVTFRGTDTAPGRPCAQRLPASWNRSP